MPHPNAPVAAKTSRHAIRMLSSIGRRSIPGSAKDVIGKRFAFATKVRSTQTISE